MKYIKVEDAVKVAGEECHEFRGIFGRIKEQLEAIPKDDVVPVVRCKDCKWQRKWLLDNGSYWHECRNGNEALGLDREFCSDGVRRTDDAEIH